MTEEMTDDQLVDMVRDNFPSEYSIMQQSLINFYHLKNHEKRTPDMVVLQQQLLSGIHSLLFVMSKVLSEELDVEPQDLFNQIYKIHIK